VNKDYQKDRFSALSFLFPSTIFPFSVFRPYVLYIDMIIGALL